MSSKVSCDTLSKTVWEAPHRNQHKHPKFFEMVELQLEELRRQKNKHFSGRVRFKSTQCPKFSVCLRLRLWTSPHTDIKTLKKLNKRRSWLRCLPQSTPFWPQSL